MKKSLLFPLFAILIFFVHFFVTSAAVNSLNGWAWSSNIGWISFSSSTSGSSVSYGVKVDANTGDFSGYAYYSADDKDTVPNERGGWINFNPTSGYPAGQNQRHGVKVDWNTGKVTGWARAITGDSNQGWDGWIKMSGSNYGVTLNTSTGKFSGFAWGSEVIGWIDFAPALDRGGGVTKAPNKLPTARINTPAALEVTRETGQSTSFNGGSSSDPDGSIDRYEWRDGGCGASNSLLSANMTFSKSHASAGTYNVCLRVRDNNGAWSTNNPSRTINVRNPAPNVSSVSPSSSVNDSSVIGVGIDGSDFMSSPRVWLAQGSSVINCSGFSFSSSRLSNGTCPISGAPIGPWSVVVENTDGQRGILSDGFVIAPPPPTLTSIVPKKGERGRTNLLITINGTNLASTNDVSISGTGTTVDMAGLATSDPSIEFEIDIDLNATISTRTVTVTTAGGSDTIEFDVTAICGNDLCEFRETIISCSIDCFRIEEI